MSRQHAAPILVPGDGSATQVLSQLDLRATSGNVSEAWIQDLVHRHPGCLPIAEVDPAFGNPVPLCRELSTPAGSIDNLLMTPSGLPVIVECKLWRNPEGRREVVGQILDYAKELARWSASDLQREVARRVPGEGNPLLRLMSEAGHSVDEISFNDALTLNLRRGRFLLLIVGDGIREGVEAIAEYLQANAGLHFSLGLIEMPVFHNPGGGHLVIPRVLARTTNIVRQVVTVPEGAALQEDLQGTDGNGIAGDAAATSALAQERQAFWTEFLQGLELDDPEQPVSRAPRQGYITFSLPAPQYSAWITVWRDIAAGQVGLTLGWTRGQPGEAAGEALVEDCEEVLAALGGDVEVVDLKGRRTFVETLDVASFDDPATREAAFAWLRARLNAWVNAFRPRIRSLVTDMEQNRSL